MLIALVLYDGVLRDECEAFRTVLTRVTNAEFVTVGRTAGPVQGPGGTQVAEMSFDEFIARRAPLEVAVVPGGIGCQRAANDPGLRWFLRILAHRAHCLAASSTGSVVLASAGVLEGKPAATHWLARSLLEKYGSAVDHHRLAIHGNVITCEGSLSALDAAFAIAERIEAPGAAQRIRDELLAAGAPWLAEPSFWSRLRTATKHRFHRPSRRPNTGRSDARRATNTNTDTNPDTDIKTNFEAGTILDETTPTASIMIELVDNTDLARQIKRNARR